MNVEYTGRQYEIPSTVRKEVETGLNKIRKILGDRFETKVILAVEKHRHKAHNHHQSAQRADCWTSAGHRYGFGCE